MSYKTAIIATNTAGSGTDSPISTGTEYNMTCQSFITTTKTKFVTKCIMSLAAGSNSTGALTCSLHLADGNHHPTGDSLGSKAHDALPGGFSGDVTFEFDSPIAVNASTLYVFTLYNSGHDNNICKVGYAWTGGTYAYGRFDKRQRMGGSWEMSTGHDQFFYTYGLVKKNSSLFVAS